MTRQKEQSIRRVDSKVFRLRRVGYQRYQIVGSPAAGTVIARAANPQASPCFRWAVESGVWPREIAGFTLRGLARAAVRAAQIR